MLTEWARGARAGRGHKQGVRDGEQDNDEGDQIADLIRHLVQAHEPRLAVLRKHTVLLVCMPVPGQYDVVIGIITLTLSLV